jgi:hypothetical protein
MMTLEQGRAALIAMGWSADRVARFESLTPELRQLELQSAGDVDFSDPSMPGTQRALDILAAFGGVGSAVGDVAGAIAGVKGL